MSPRKRLGFLVTIVHDYGCYKSGACVTLRLRRASPDVRGCGWAAPRASGMGGAAQPATPGIRISTIVVPLGGEKARGFSWPLDRLSRALRTAAQKLP